MSVHDRLSRCAVFCISEIPTTTLDRLLYFTDKYWEPFSEPGDPITSIDSIIFVDTKDIHNTSKLRISSAPVEFSPTAFIGSSVEEVGEWFDLNITQAEHPGFLSNVFLILDEQSVRDETLLFFCTQDAPLQSLRCHFDMAMDCAVNCDAGQSIEEGTMGSFMRTGVVMTAANEKIAAHGGLYIEDGEVKLDQYWRDFIQQ